MNSIKLALFLEFYEKIIRLGLVIFFCIFVEKNFISKKTLEEALPNFPNEFSIDEIVERLILIEKIENGRNLFKEEKTLSSDEVKLKMAGF